MRQRIVAGLLVLGTAMGMPAERAAAFPIQAGQGTYSDPGITDTTIRLGMFAPMSGPNQAYGQDAVLAARMWYDMINRMGGIWGRRIELVIEDDRCAANDLVAAVRKLVEQDRVFMLNGGACSAAVVAAQDYIVRQRIPLVMLNASGDGALYPPTDWIFGAISISQHAVGGTAIDFAVRRLNAHTIGYLNHDDAYGAWNLEAAQATARELNVELKVESVNPAITDVTAPMLRLRSQRPDAIIIATYARPAALIIRRAHELGMTAPIVLAANGTPNLPQLAETVGTRDALQNFYIQDVINDAPDGARQRWIQEWFRRTYPDVRNPSPVMPYGITTAQVVTYGIMLAGPNPTRERVAWVLRNLHFESGVMAGPIEFGGSNRAGHQQAIFLRYDGQTQTLQEGTYLSRWVYRPQ